MTDNDTDLAPPIVTPADRMQRVRVGVTGLAAVMIVVAVATAIATGVRHQADASSPANVAAMSNSVDANSEPLAQLGAAPGGSPDKRGNSTR